MTKRMLVLENGKVFYGESFGSLDTVVAELVFNTSMVGYQEILSDSSYCGQMVTMTYPLIGNYGLADEDYESKKIFMSGMIVREYNDFPSNFRFTKTLSEVMEEYGVVGISGVDTREITKIIRDEGEMKAIIADASESIEECLKKLREYELPKNQVETVSTKKVWHARTKNPEFNVVAVDCGIKLSTVQKLNQFGANVVVVPYNTTVQEVMSFKPNGLYLSNGPGNPEDVPEVIELVRALRGVVPILGISLGHQIIALAYGGKTYKKKFGHRGANHSVKNLSQDKIEITAQNHSYAVLADSLVGTTLEVTHINLSDNEIEGLQDKSRDVASMQYHPQDTDGHLNDMHLFLQFGEAMKKAREKGNAKENRY